MADIISSLVGALVGAVVTYVTTQSKIRLELESKYDQGLRDARLTKYQELWKELQLLAKYARPALVTYKAIKSLTASLRQWYFESGGMYLSTPARDAYFALQDACKDILSNPQSKAMPDAELDEQAFELLRAKGSALRTAMVGDVMTRKESLLGER